MSNDTQENKLYDLELERLLLGGILFNENSFYHIAGMVKPYHFVVELHQEIFKWIEKTSADGSPATAKLAAIHFLNKDILEGVDSYTYFSSLSEDIIDPDNLKDYGKALINLWTSRQLIETIEAAKLKVYKDKEPETAISELESSFMDIRSGSQEKTLFNSGELLEDFIENYSNANPTLSKTYLNELDRLIGGLDKGEEGLIAGRPAMGKSAIALFIAFINAVKGKSVAYISLDMTKIEILVRIASLAIKYKFGTNVEYDKIKRKELTKEQYGMLLDVQPFIKSLPLYFETKEGLSVAEIAAKIRHIKAMCARKGQELHLAFIDHFSQIPAPNNRPRDTASATYIAETLKRAIKSLDIPVWVLCQLNRGVENQEDKRPQLKDLRETGSLEQEANMVLGLYYEGYYIKTKRPVDTNSIEYDDWQRDYDKAKHIYEIIALKLRSSETGKVALYCDMGLNYYSTLAREE